MTNINFTNNDEYICICPPLKYQCTNDGKCVENELGVYPSLDACLKAINIGECTNVATPTVTPTNTITPTVTPTKTLTNTPTPTKTNTLTPTITPTSTLTPTPQNTKSPTPTVTPTKTLTNTPTLTKTSTNTPTPTVTLTPTLTVTPTLTATSTATPTHTPTVTQTPTITKTKTPTPTLTSTVTPTPSSSNAEILLNPPTVNQYTAIGSVVGTFSNKNPGFSSPAGYRYVLLDIPGDNQLFDITGNETLITASTILVSNKVYSLTVFCGRADGFGVGGYSGPSFTDIVEINVNPSIFGCTDNLYALTALSSGLCPIEICDISNNSYVINLPYNNYIYTGIVPESINISYTGTICS